MQMAIQYLKDAVSPFTFLLLEANGGGGQCDLILYGDQADTEFLQAIYVRIGVQEIAAQPGHARYDHGTHPSVKPDTLWCCHALTPLSRQGRS